MAVATKIAMIPLVIRRIDEHLRDLDKLLQSDETRVGECLDRAIVYRINDSDLMHDAIIDFDSFIFESRSAYEITISFIERFFELILGNPPVGASAKKGTREVVERALQERGAQTHWIKLVANARNHLIHARAPWLTFEEMKGKSFRFDPVLLTKHVQRLEDDPDRVSIEQCRSIWQGFTASYAHIEAWLKEEIACADND